VVLDENISKCHEPDRWCSFPAALNALTALLDLRQGICQARESETLIETMQIKKKRHHSEISRRMM
jgi:hypothetical protein